MERKICLDSDIIIDHINGRDEGRLNEVLKDANVRVHMTSVTVYELNLRTRNLEQISQFLRNANILPLDEDSAKISAEITKRQEKKGQPIGLPDVLIAGICIANQCILFTNNKRDFSRISHLSLLSH